MNIKKFIAGIRKVKKRKKDIALTNPKKTIVFAKKRHIINPLSANPRKWSNTLKQFVGKLPTNCLSVFDHFMGLALKG